METATHIDLDILTFWELTPFEFDLMVKAYIRKSEQEEKMKLRLTYLGASWQRAKKLPSLERILSVKTQKEMTPEEMLQKVMALNKAFGGTKEEVK